VRLGDDGDYVFLGRRDAQIKRRGYRIELGEIETAVYAHPAVVEAAIVAIPDEASTTRILAYVVARDGLQAGDLSEFVLQRIPRYMLPDEIEFRSALPKTSTGKVDRRALTET
jgi:acyl-coenzyme A synthetase/AMP-(fatty) acid ligase